MNDTKKTIITETLEKLNKLEQSNNEKDKEMFTLIIGMVKGAMMFNESK